MLDIGAILERLSTDPDQDIPDILKRYNIDEAEFIDQINDILPQAVIGSERSPYGLLAGGFIAGLEYATIYNEEKQAGI